MSIPRNIDEAERRLLLLKHTLLQTSDKLKQNRLKREIFALEEWIVAYERCK